MKNRTGIFPVYKLYQADFTFNIGRSNTALDIYQDIMQKDPAYSVLPYINAATLDPAMAETYLLQGFEYFPRTELLLERLGEFYYRNGDTASARDIFNLLMEIHPGHPSAEIRLADMELGAGFPGQYRTFVGVIPRREGRCYCAVSRLASFW